MQSSVCVPVLPHIAARQQDLLFNERSVRPFNAGALTERSSGSPLSQTEIRDGPKREQLV
jgi:hypothetical protein